MHTHTLRSNTAKNAPNVILFVSHDNTWFRPHTLIVVRTCTLNYWALLDPNYSRDEWGNTMSVCKHIIYMHPLPQLGPLYLEVHILLMHTLLHVTYMYMYMYMYTRIEVSDVLVLTGSLPRLSTHTHTDTHIPCIPHTIFTRCRCAISCRVLLQRDLVNTLQCASAHGNHTTVDFYDFRGYSNPCFTLILHTLFSSTTHSTHSFPHNHCLDTYIVHTA